MRRLALAVATVIVFLVLSSLSSFAPFLFVAWVAWMIYEGLRWSVRRVRQRRTPDVLTAEYRRH